MKSGSNKLYIENSDSSSPLLYGEFDNDYLKINGDLEVTGNLIAVVSGVSIFSYCRRSGWITLS